MATFLKDWVWNVCFSTYGMYSMPWPNTLDLVEMHLIDISFSCRQPKDYFYFDIHMETKPFRKMQKKAAGRNADKGEGVGRWTLPPGQLSVIRRRDGRNPSCAHKPQPVHPSPVCVHACMHAWRYTYASWTYNGESIIASPLRSSKEGKIRGLGGREGDLGEPTSLQKSEDI